MQISKCQHHLHAEKNFCRTCGSYFSKSMNLIATKTQRFQIQSSSNDLTEIKSNITNFKSIQTIPLPDQVIEVIRQVSDKHNWSLKTQAMGIYLYSHYSSKHLIASQNPIKYLLMSMYLVSKVEEHTMIKGLKKFRKECGKCFSFQDYIDFQAQILVDIDFDFNVITFVDLIYFYLRRGIIFCGEREKVQKAQNKVLALTRSFIQSGMFISMEQQKLAIFIIYKSRVDCYFAEVWNWAIQQYSQTKAQSAKAIYKQMGTLIWEIDARKSNQSQFVSQKMIGSQALVY